MRYSECIAVFTYLQDESMPADKQTSNVHAQTLVLSHDAESGTLRVRKTKLLVVSGQLQGREFIIAKDLFTLGSGAHNDLVLNDTTISKRHCEISVDGDGYQIRDLESTNGTIIQGVKVSSAFLTPGAEIQLGKTRLVFVYAGQVSSFHKMGMLH